MKLGQAGGGIRPPNGSLEHDRLRGPFPHLGQGAACSGEGKDSNSSGKWGGGDQPLLSPRPHKATWPTAGLTSSPLQHKGGASLLLCPGQELTEQQRALWAAFPREKAAGGEGCLHATSHTPNYYGRKPELALEVLPGAREGPSWLPALLACQLACRKWVSKRALGGPSIAPPQTLTCLHCAAGRPRCHTCCRPPARGRRCPWPLLMASRSTPSNGPGKVRRESWRDPLPGRDLGSRCQVEWAGGQHLLPFPLPRGGGGTP